MDTASRRADRFEGWCAGGVRVALEKTDGIVTGVALLDASGAVVVPVDRFLAHVLASGGSPNTALAYGYDLRYVFEFFAERDLDWREFRPTLALDLLGWLRRRLSRRPAQRLGLAATVNAGRLLSPATVARVLAAVSSFYQWARRRAARR